jgi:FkbM family methyltransferase
MRPDLAQFIGSARRLPALLMKESRKFVPGVLRHTPYEIGRRMPPVTLSPVRLLLAYYCALGRQTVIQIGACDGSAGDPLMDFLHTGKLRGILVEPVPHSYEKLVTTYEGVPGVTTVQAAVSKQDGEGVMYCIRPTGKWADSEWAPQVASFDKRHILKLGISPNSIEKLQVPLISLESLIAKYSIVDIGLLQVDAEGYDSEIVRMALSLLRQPKALNFETTHIPHPVLMELFDLLQRNKYSLVYDADNALAISKVLQDEFAGGAVPVSEVAWNRCAESKARN